MVSRLEKPTWLGRWLRIWTLVVFVGYPLSIGPATWFLDNDSFPPEARWPVQLFYAPLTSLAGQSDILLRVLVSYLSLFVDSE